ncbi:MAG: CHASE2 domain-containing protein, partial [Kovacikia sp.]
MSKRAVVRLDGSLEEGLRVTLEVGEEGNLHFAEEDGRLPPAPDLIQSLEDWQQSYPFLEGMRIKLEHILVQPGTEVQAEDCRKQAKKLQQQLKAWLGSGSFHVIDTQLREAVSREDLIRVVLRCQDRRLHLLPWHTWDFIDRYQAEVAFSLPARKSDQVGKLLNTRKKVRILAILGNSDGINTTVDRAILETLTDAEVVFLIEPLRQQLNEQLWEQPWDILFFAGHSQTEDCAGRIFINANDSLTIDDLRFALKRAIARGLQLAIFNSCDGLGLVYELEPLGIPQLVVMRQPVPDRVAQEFLKHLLTGLVAGQRFYLAVREAREKLQSLEDRYPCASWLPVIFQNPNQPPLIWQDLHYPTEWDSEVRRRKVKSYEPSSNCQPELTWHRLHKELLIVLCASMVITGLIMGARWHGKLQPWELQAFDLLMRQRPVEEPDSRLLVIRATAEDLERLKEPILSDRIILQLLEKLKPYQPRAIGLDIFRHIPQGKEHQQLINHLKQENNIFAVCSWQNPEDPANPGFPPPAQMPDDRVAFADMEFDADRTVRRHSLRALPPETSCKASSSLSLMLALKYLEKDGIEPDYDSNGYLSSLGRAIFKPVDAHTGGYQNLDRKKYLGGDQ